MTASVKRMVLEQLREAHPHAMALGDIQIAGHELDWDFFEELRGQGLISFLRHPIDWKQRLASLTAEGYAQANSSS
jgi:hypothetical protein